MWELHFMGRFKKGSVPQISPYPKFPLAASYLVSDKSTRQSYPPAESRRYFTFRRLACFAWYSSYLAST